MTNEHQAASAAADASMANTSQLPKLGILEEDDEFEEFPIEGILAVA